MGTTSTVPRSRSDQETGSSAGTSDGFITTRMPM